MEPEPTPHTSVHTNTFPPLLQTLGCSIAVSTYQAGKLFFLREDGDVLNTHFRGLHVPMGVAYAGGRLAVGTKSGWSEFHEVPSLKKTCPPEDRVSTVFVPRLHYVTGSIAIHEIAYNEHGQLWAVNTRFSCLCTFDQSHSFVPRWRPNFISGYSPDDRCHLNGMCLVDGQPKYVTALGTTDVGGAWREHRVTGGVLMDVPSQSILIDGLSMPHSPRWYRGKLWYLESGHGTLVQLDPFTGSRTVVAHMPGFTRGLDFHGDYAFVGLSQVRESNLFSKLPITEKLTVEQRACGVWAIHLPTGNIVAFVKFTGGVQEVFSVVVLPHTRPELLNDETDERLEATYVLPDDALREVTQAAEAVI